MLSAYLWGAAVVGRETAEGAPHVVRALMLLESEPSLHDDPRHQSRALLCGRWLLDPRSSRRHLRIAIDWRQSGRPAAGRPWLTGRRSVLGRRGTALVRRPRPGVRDGREAVELRTCWLPGRAGVAHETLAIESPPGGTTPRRQLCWPGRGGRRATGLGTCPRTWPHAVLACALSSRGSRPVVRTGRNRSPCTGARTATGAARGDALAGGGISGLGRTGDARELTDRYLGAQPYRASLHGGHERPLSRHGRGGCNEAARSSIGPSRYRPRWATGRRRVGTGCCRACDCGGPASGSPPGPNPADDAGFCSGPPRRVAAPGHAELAGTGERLARGKAPAEPALSSQEYPGRSPGGAGQDEQGGGGRPVPQSEDRRAPSRGRAAQAGPAVADRAGPRLRGSVTAGHRGLGRVEADRGGQRLADHEQLDREVARGPQVEVPSTVALDQPGMGDAVLVQRGPPPLQVVEVRNGQGEVVETRMMLVEAAPRCPRGRSARRRSGPWVEHEAKRRVVVHSAPSRARRPRTGRPRPRRER